MVIRMIVIATLVVICGCASTTPLMKHERLYERTIHLDGIPRAQIFDRSLEWLRLYVADSATAPVSDRANGNIHCYGRMVRPFSAANLTGTDELTFIARETVSEESLTLSFELLSVVTPTTYNPVTYYSPGRNSVVLHADLIGARNNFDSLTNSLRKYLLNDPANDRN